MLQVAVGHPQNIKHVKTVSYPFLILDKILFNDNTHEVNIVKVVLTQVYGLIKDKHK